MRAIKSLNTPSKLEVRRADGGVFELKVTFPNGDEKAASVTADELRGLTHDGASVHNRSGVKLRRKFWNPTPRKPGPAPRCVYIYFEGKGSDLIVVTHSDLIRATGVRP